jgi:hypothetical protein
MAIKQEEFLIAFCNRFERTFGAQSGWYGGQKLNNKGELPKRLELRRNGIARPNEGFELGDRRLPLRQFNVVVEFDSGCVGL